MAKKNVEIPLLPFTFWVKMRIKMMTQFSAKTFVFLCVLCGFKEALRIGDETMKSP